MQGYNISWTESRTLGASTWTKPWSTYCKHPYAAVVTYPFSAQTKKKTRDEMDEQPGTSKQEEPVRKKARKEGKNTPKDDITFRKYGPNNIPANVKLLILEHLQNQNLFEEKPELQQKC